MAETIKRTRKNKKRPLHSTGRLIKQLRKGSGYTQEELKNILGFQATSAISKIESRDFIPDILRLQKLLTLLAPTPEQKHKILDYYGYKENDLPEKEDFVKGLKEKANKGDILSALHTLFYLFVYKQNYTAVTETVQELYQKKFYMPQAVKTCKREVEMVIREIFSCRRMLAQGMLTHQAMALEEALQRAEMANELLVMTMDRYKKKLKPEGLLYLNLLRLHIAFCAENTYFGRLQIEPNLEPDFFDKKSTEARDERNLPRVQQVMDVIESISPDHNLEDIRQMNLFIEREALHLLYLQSRHRSERVFKDYLKNLDIEVEGPLTAAHWVDAVKAKRPSGVFKGMYESVFKTGKVDDRRWEPVFERFRQILRDHQKVQNWDGNTVQSAIVNTFLNYPELLARLGNFAWAEDVLNLLYLQLTVAETHFRWTQKFALVKAFEYIRLTQLNTTKFSDKDLAPIEKTLTELTRLLDRAVKDLTESKGLNAPLNLKKIFLEEPVFYLVFLHASKHNQLKEREDVVTNMERIQQQIALAQENAKA